jgi:alkanesulfonate monooxygenase SsuD/methylene tetrahydromethanopterin reductase-like flavin-dependent oxidoreductase (luciferase family)
MVEPDDPDRAQAQAIRTAFSQGNHAAMVNAVSDDILAALAFAGTKDNVREQVHRFEELDERLIPDPPFCGIGPEEARANHAGLMEALSA